MLKRVVMQAEGLVKGLCFDCRRCGACVLTSTRLICPMTCPKKLRNGSCGGTLDGRCEVHPERACVWVRIQGRRHRDRLETPPILPAQDPTLQDTPSYWNLVTGADRVSRTPLTPFPPTDALDPRPRTASRLEAACKSGRTVFTTELRTPRGIDSRKLLETAAELAGTFDGLNATAYLAGKPSLPPGLLAGQLAAEGIEVIAQATTRDHTATTFGGELIGLRAQGVHNLLCLTGDWASDPQAGRQIYDGDSAVMLHRARSAEVDQPTPRRIFLGAAINPLSTPVEVPVRRLMQKVAGGAEFVQTQVVTATAGFAAFWERCRSVDLHRQVHLLAGLPVVTSRKALEHLGRIAGVQVDPAFAAAFAGATDLSARGIEVAVRLGRELLAQPGVRGLHLMLFGSDHRALLAVRQALSPITQPKDIPCPSCL